MRQESFLIIEDEAITARYIEMILKQMEFENIYISTDISEIIDIVTNKKIDISLLDINLNKSFDGLDIARKILNIQSHKQIVISANHDSLTMSRANDIDIQTFITKPFTPEQLKATVLMCINQKETQQSAQNTLIHLASEYTFNIEKKSMSKNNKEISLTKGELEFLSLLAKAKNQFLTYTDLEHALWRDDSVTDSTRRSFISRLNKKFDTLLIKTIHSQGYKLLLS